MRFAEGLSSPMGRRHKALRARMDRKYALGLENRPTPGLRLLLRALGVPQPTAVEGDSEHLLLEALLEGA
jgi:hypothetical protein